MNFKKPLSLKGKTILLTTLSIIAIIAILMTLSLIAELSYETSPPPSWHFDPDLTMQWKTENSITYDIAIYRESFCGKCYPISIKLYRVTSDSMALLMTGFLLENGSIELQDFQ